MRRATIVVLALALLLPAGVLAPGSRRRPG
jgi:hypothetical protein